MVNEKDLQSEEVSNKAAELKMKSLQDAKKFAEEQKRLQQELVQQWRQQLAEQQADQDMTLASEAYFWTRRMETARVGSISFTAAIEEANKLIARMRGENVWEQKAFDETAGKVTLPDTMTLSRDGGFTGGGRDASSYVANLRESIDLQRKNATALAETPLRMATSTGRISRLDAAQVQQPCTPRNSPGLSVASRTQSPPSAPTLAFRRWSEKRRSPAQQSIHAAARPAGYAADPRPTGDRQRANWSGDARLA